MKQSEVIRAYKALAKLGQQNLPIRLAYDLFKLKTALQPQYDFQVAEEQKASANATANPDGSISFGTPEEAAAFRQKLMELGDIDVELKVKPVQIPLSIPGLTLSMDDVEALDRFILFTNTKKGE